ncbi:hypothetical protein TW1_034 [Pseudoalteromonas phage TW1]|jgi:hypothetical protein|uniref:hypothetical protein n=1 Tax=Pseudoalteromonas phage TW1 TaxID=1366055 RepID=UPI00035AB4BF|nr:hypothetical protein PP585_gp34 [Pseudoalteromonas phage TW1]AGR46550.1 hypothetical protein TW1_034 [Pseudoalteromonas phage TW1]
MIDITSTIQTKSDQLNSDDLLGGDLMIQVEGVQLANDPQQPLHIFYVGCNGKPYKPCLTVRKILAALWGKDASQWAGRYMNLYLDPTVKWAGKEVGGIRVNALSHIQSSATLNLAVRRGAKQPFRIEQIPLQQN